MEINKKPNGYWTIERCREEALKCTNSRDFKIQSYTAYNKAVLKKWLKDITSHFEVLNNKYKRFIYAYEFPDNHVYVGLTYDIEKRKSEHSLKGGVFKYSKKVKLIPMFRQIIFSPVGEQKARELEQFHLEDYISKGWSIINKAKTGSLGGNNIKWTFEKLQEEAKKYTSKKYFREGNESAYSTAKSKKILDNICLHMDFKIRKPAGFWNYITCKQEAFRYKTRTEYSKQANGSYEVATKNGWLDEICSHMKSN
jgi:predicted GIY-YIG superfamily endonuclease